VIGYWLRAHSVARRLPVTIAAGDLAAAMATIAESRWQTYNGRHYDEGKYLSVDVSGEDAFRDIVGNIPARPRMARLTRLLPNGRISKHRDNNVPRNVCRFHIPAVTNDASEFEIGGVLLTMRAGEIWQIDPRFAHRVHNAGATDRIHLIIDVDSNAALDQWLASHPSVRTASLLPYVTRELVRRAAARLAR
jgi:hypothetical protein